MKHHPFTEVWPLMTGQHFAELKADIKANGLRVAIITYEGMVLDGRNRERACEETGIPPHYVETTASNDQEALDLVVSLNTHRRHLTTAQRAFAAEALAKLQNGSNQHAKKVGGSKEPPTICETLTLRQTAAKVGSSFGSAKRARIIARHGTQIDKEEVLAGKVPLSRKANTLLKVRNPRGPKTKPPKPNHHPTRGPSRVVRLHDVPPLKALTREQVDPEFTGSAMDWVDKYGHVQVMTAEQYATTRFDDWASNARALAKRWRELPELREVDHNWLRSPNQYSVKTLTESLEFLRPKIAELEALLACATAALSKKPVHQEPHQSACG